ncbi:hypothetical protein [Aneurinibacillus sp. REN35]|uniref:hypothetical protein n=1 Tax=Aneurinibacillus sp. REN35 TaxID=3237286 RepID=UPI003528EB59
MSEKETEHPLTYWIDHMIWINKFGKDAAYGCLLDIKDDYLILKKEDREVYYRIDQIQSMTVKNKEEASNPNVSAHTVSDTDAAIGRGHEIARMEIEADQHEEVAASAEVKEREIESGRERQVDYHEGRVGKAEVYVENGNDISDARVIAWDKEADRLFEDEEDDDEDEQGNTKFFNVNIESEAASSTWKANTPSKSSILFPAAKTETPKVPADTNRTSETASNKGTGGAAEYIPPGTLILDVPAPSKKKVRTPAKSTKPNKRKSKERKPKAKPLKKTVWLSKKVNRGALK